MEQITTSGITGVAVGTLAEQLALETRYIALQEASELLLQAAGLIREVANVEDAEDLEMLIAAGTLSNTVLDAYCTTGAIKRGEA